MRVLALTCCLSVCFGGLIVEGGPIDTEGGDAELFRDLLRIRALLQEETRETSLNDKPNSVDKVDERDNNIAEDEGQLDERGEDTPTLDSVLEALDDRSDDASELEDNLEELNSLRELVTQLKANRRRQKLMQLSKDTGTVDEERGIKRGWFWHCPSCDQTKFTGGSRPKNCKCSVPSQSALSIDDGQRDEPA